MNTDPDVLSRMSVQMQAMFPAILTHRSAVSKQLMQLMRGFCISGGFSDFRRTILAVHMSRYAELQVALMSVLFPYLMKYSLPETRCNTHAMKHTFTEIPTETPSETPTNILSIVYYTRLLNAWFACSIERILVFVNAASNGTRSTA